MKPYVFVTGNPRSGTTLLDKLISSHSRAFVLSQPLPLLYVEVKRAFLKTRGGLKRAHGRTDVYPLNDMFAENYYRPSEFVAFLSDYRLGSEFCRKTLEAMVSYPGQYTKPGNPFLVLERYSPCSLYDFVTAYCRSIAPAGTFELIGSKESYCEEYIPYFLTEGARVIQIIRDPRDIIASLNYGRGEVFGGRIRPHLLNLRQWRKSVAFALQYAGDPGFLAVRYEDLVRDPGATMGIVYEFLALDPVRDAVYEQDIRAQDGAVWDSNSSHFKARRVDSRSVGRYRELLSRETDRFVQASCFCEMRVLGYELDIGPDDVPGIVNRYQEDVPLTRPELAAYAWSAQRREEELRRLGCLRNGSFEPFFFLFERAFLRLCEETG